MILWQMYNGKLDHCNLHNDSDKILCNYIQELYHYCFESILILSIDMSRENDHILQITKKVDDKIMVIEKTLSTLTNIFENSSFRKITFLDSVIPLSKTFFCI